MRIYVRPASTTVKTCSAGFLNASGRFGTFASGSFDSGCVDIVTDTMDHDLLLVANENDCQQFCKSFAVADTGLSRGLEIRSRRAVAPPEATAGSHQKSV